jgi:hypothetical protein
MIGCVASLFVCAYPFLRTHQLSPIQLVSNVASAVSTDRNKSFQTRVENEEQLLAKANQKPLLGWGAMGRNRIFDKWTGQDISVTDGAWIIQYGAFGWFGYLALFGLLAVAQFRAFRAMDKEATPANLVRGGLALILTVYIVDSIPNSGQISIIFLLAGSIASTARARRTSLVSPPRTIEKASPPQVAVAQ